MNDCFAIMISFDQVSCAGEFGHCGFCEVNYGGDDDAADDDDDVDIFLKYCCNLYTPHHIYRDMVHVGSNTRADVQVYTAMT